MGGRVSLQHRRQELLDMTVEETASGTHEPADPKGPSLPSQARKLMGRVRQRSASVGVIGLGYVGLPTAIAFAEEGFDVVGIDRDEDRCRSVNAGRSHVEDVEDSRLAPLVKLGHLRAASTLGDAGHLDIIDICVPTPLDKARDPDLSAVLAVRDALPAAMERGQLIVLSSTTYPGTTTELLQPVVQSQGYEVGTDTFLAFAPERIDPGNHTFGIRNTPKVVGGVTAACTAVAEAVFATIVDEVVPVSSTTTAEVVKLLENTFRSINIALANEMAIICRQLGVDVWEVIDAAATKPYGFMPFYPGPGLGGHCIPVDPSYLSWKLRRLNYAARFIGLAEDINRQMPHHVVQRVTDILNDQGRSVRGSNILVLGLSYKPDVADIRESPALEVLDLLKQRGAEVHACDPHVRVPVALGDAVVTPEVLTTELAAAANIVVVITAHSAFDRGLILRHARTVLDTRGWRRHEPPAWPPAPGWHSL